MITVVLIDQAAVDTFLVHPPQPRSTQHQTHRAVRVRAFSPQAATTTLALLAFPQFQGIAFWQLTGRGQRPGELPHQLGAEPQKVKSPFFRSIS